MQHEYMKTTLVSSVGTFMPCVNDVGYVREIVATAVDLQVSYEEKAERQQSRISDYITLIIAIFCILMKLIFSSISSGTIYQKI